MKNVAVLGSTGSIGTQVLDVISRFPYRFKIVGLSAGKNFGLLKEQIKKFKPEVVSVADLESAKKLGKVGVPVFFGEDSLVKVATCKNADVVLVSVAGNVGLLPTIEAIKSGKDIALATKEVLVTAGKIVMDLAKKNNVKIIPVDSEHSAIFQCLNGEDKKEIRKIILTCSGGSFRGKTLKDLKNVCVKDALNHPNWSMGKKIKIDCSTLMNKGLEIIEAHYLFDIPYKKIEVVIHPQSIVHSMIEFVDGSVIAQLGLPDMRLPILYALSYPQRLDLDLPKIDFSKLNLNFSKPDTKTFPILDYAIYAGKKGGTYPCALNAGNEIAVEYFLKGKIKFLDISKVVKHILDENKEIENPTILQIIEADKNAREKTRKYIEDNFIKSI
jgi:1-deoxy-D-xylulose-5-phosphate reductoisomerase